MTNVFISYSSKDRHVATEIGEQLRKRDFLSFFLDFDPEQGIPAGRRWEKELYHRLLACSAVLFVCSTNSLSSKWCFAELTHARALDKNIIPVRVSNCTLPEILDGLQAIDWSEGSETAYQRLWKELERIGVSEDAGFPWDGTRPPYPGIYAFQEADAAIYFGRKEEASQLVELLKRMRFGESRLALVIGASGSGKSSLVRAGMLPRIRRQKEAFIPLEPLLAGSGLIENLAEQLISVHPKTGERVGYDTVYKALMEAASGTERLEGSAFSSLLRQLRIAARRKDAHYIFIVDQAERLLAGDNATNKALQLIRNCASSPGLPLQIVLTLRSDHLDAFQASAPMDGVRFESFLLSPLSNQRFGEIIEGPARLVGLRLAPGLVPALASDASRRDGLPLLAFVLRELWDRFGRKNKQLSLEDYQAGLGGLEGCVGNRAKQVMAEQSLSEAQLALLKKTMCRMARISEGDTLVGQPIAWKSVPEQIQPTIQRLIDARLLVINREKESKVEVAHEVLFRAWEELENWLKEELFFLRWQRSIQLPLQEWERHAKNTKEVHLSGVQLREAREWLGSHATSMNELERRFVEASLAYAQEEAERWYRSYQISLVRQLAAQAQVILAFESAEFTDRALLLAVEAMRRCKDLGVPSLEADQALRYGLALNARLKIQNRAKQAVNFKAVCAHPHATTVAYGQKDGQVWLWDLLTNNIETGPKLSSAIEQLLYSPDGKWLLVGDEAGDCLLLNTVSGDLRKMEQTGSRFPVNAVAFSMDSSNVAVAFYNRVLVWELKKPDDPVVLEPIDNNTSTIVSMVFSADGTMLATQMIMREALCWNWRSKEVVGQIGERGNQVHQSSDGRFLGVTGLDFKALLWDVFRRELLPLANNSSKLAFSADARFVGIASPEHFIRIWHLPDLTVAHTMRHNAEVWDLDFSPDGSMLVSAARNNVARVWDTHTGKEITRMVHHDHLWSARFLADSRHVLTQSGDGTITLWDTKELREIRLLQHRVAVLGVAFSPEGRYLATNAREAWGKLTPVLIDFIKAQPVTDLKTTDGQPVNATQYAQELLDKHKESSQGKIRSPDREYLAFAEGTMVKVYRAGKDMEEEEITKGEPFCTLPHEHEVLRIVFSPDSRHLVTASDHDTARVWDISLSIEVSRLTHENPNVVDVDFYRSGPYIATGSWDHTARVWTWKPEDLIREASSRLTRNLSPGEWHRYLPEEPYRKTIPEIED